MIISHMDNVTLRNSQPQKETIFKSGDGWIYRIPALFYERESKTILAFAEQRKSKDDTSTKKLVMKTGRLKEESSDVRTFEWSDLKHVEKAHREGFRPMNPCPVYEKNSKTLFLFFICVEDEVSEGWQIKHCDNKARLCYIKSEDIGQSWSDVTDLTDNVGNIKNWATFAVGPGHGIQMKSGRLVVPVYAYVCCCSSCCLFFQSMKVAPYALPLYSEDDGKTWQLGKMLPTESIECEMAEFIDDKDNSVLYCNARTKGGYRVEALEENKVEAFKILPLAKKLVETGEGCQGSVVSFPAQSEDANTESDPNQNPNKWLLFTHPTDKTKRIDLGVYLNKSPQDATAWSKPWIVSSGPSGYSDLAYIDDGWFACLLECGVKEETEQIACVVFNYSQVKQGIGELKKGFNLM